MSKFNFYEFTNGFEDFILPFRSHPLYTEVDDFQDYELSNNIAYELASRNPDIQNELQKYITLEQLQTRTMAECYNSNSWFDPEKFEKFDYGIFFKYGFNQFAIDYLLFRNEAKNYSDERNNAHDGLLDLCKGLRKGLGYNVNNSYYHRLLYRYTSIEEYFNDITEQGISCPYIIQKNEIHKVGYFNETYYKDWSDEPYNLTEISKDNYIQMKGLYTYQENIFKRVPIRLGHDSYDHILPTASVVYSRPPMKNPYQNRHLFLKLNLNLTEDEIISNVKRIIEIDKMESSVKKMFHIKEIFNASDLFFEKRITYRQPKGMKKNKLSVYYADLLFAYDTIILFDEYLKMLETKYLNGLKEINSRQNMFHTDKIDRENQKKQIMEWYKDKKSRRSVQDKIYMEIFDCDRAPANHQVNTLLTLAKKLIEKKEYRFLI